jgi:membrane associated rhomboid family serine protease
LAKSDEQQAAIARFFLGDGDLQWWTPLTYAFLHGDWTHVGLNCVWFVAFGAPVARRFGVRRFLIFCFATAIAGAAVHFLTHMTDLQPVIGASAIVSGAMGAAVRFAFQPGASLGSRRGDAMGAGARPAALSLSEVVGDRRAMSFLAFWFLSNILFGVAAAPLGISESAIAWEAHIGGFLVGLLAFRWFDSPSPPPLLESA